MRKIHLLALTLSASCAKAVQPAAWSATSPELTSTAADTSAAAVAEGWWRALTLGDTAFMARHTSERLTLTLSNGQQLDRSVLFADVATHVPKPSTFVRPATDVAVLPAAGSVVVTSRIEEGSQGGSNHYRYLAVLERVGSVWQVVAAHSTREIGLTTRVSAEVSSGALADTPLLREATCIRSLPAPAPPSPARWRPGVAGAGG